VTRSPPLVSILVPAYNAAPWLAATLESALSQDWPEKECIVWDDGSTDATLEIARSFEARGVVVLSGPNRGASGARNAAFAASRGEWIQYLDADDQLHPGKISRQMEVALASERRWLLCGNWARFVDSPGNAASDAQILSEDAAPVDWLVRKFNTHAMMHPGAWLAPRALLEKAGPWDARLSLDDDGEYFTRVLLASEGTRYCKGALSYYRSSVAGSLSGRRSRAAHESAYLSCSLCARHLLAAEDSPRTRAACAALFMWLCFEIYPQHRDIVAAAEEEVRRYGGSSLLPPGGTAFTAIARTLGWKVARRVQASWRRAPGTQWI
jgi:glycosyltransferase involved in cell wall biosynthesis